MELVLNRHRDVIPTGAVYIGRGSAWGNEVASHVPGAKVGQVVATREEAIRLWWRTVRHTALVRQARQLRGRILVCYCAPLPCHGDILARLAATDDLCAEVRRVDAELAAPVTLLDLMG